MSFKDINTKTSSVLIPFNGDLSIKIGTEFDCLTNIKQISFKQSQINTALALTLNHFTVRNDEIISTFFFVNWCFCLSPDIYVCHLVDYLSPDEKK